MHGRLDWLANDSSEEQRYTLPAIAAAVRRGVISSVITRACKRGEIDAVKKDNRWLLNEESFKSWRPTGQGKRKLC